jgi:hypothetical protein
MVKDFCVYKKFNPSNKIRYKHFFMKQQENGLQERRNKVVCPQKSRLLVISLHEEVIRNT